MVLGDIIIEPNDIVSREMFIEQFRFECEQVSVNDLLMISKQFYWINK